MMGFHTILKGGGGPGAPARWARIAAAALARRLRFTLESWELALGRFWAAPRDPGRPGRGRGIAVDASVVGLALVYGVMIFIAETRNAPGSSLDTGDAIQIISFALARLEPHLFAGDAMLGEPSQFILYDNFHLRFLLYFGKYFADYQTAFQFLSIPFTLLHVAGFYLLGIFLFKSRYWGVLLALACFASLKIPWGSWGPMDDPLPRTLYFAAFPWLVLGALVWRERPGRWFWLMVAAGALTYGHPVSGPFVAFALWCGLFAFKPEAWDRTRFVRHMILCGAVFVVTIAPYVVHHFSTSQVLDAENYEAVIRAAKSRVSRDNLDFVYGLKQLGAYFGWRHAYFVVALAGLVLALGGRIGDKAPARFFLFLILGLLFIAGLIPYADETISAALARFPAIVSASRNMVYLVPLGLLLFFCALRWAGAAYALRRMAGLFAAIATLAWIGTSEGLPTHGVPTLSCWARGSFFCAPEPDNDIAFLKALEARIPQGARIFGVGTDYSLRILIRRPVVWSEKDGAFLAQTAHGALLEWAGIRDRWMRIHRIKDARRRFLEWRELARELGAEYVVIYRGAWRPLYTDHKAAIGKMFSETLYTDDMGALLRL